MQPQPTRAGRLAPRSGQSRRRRPALVLISEPRRSNIRSARGAVRAVLATLALCGALGAPAGAGAQATRFPGGEGSRTLDTSGNPKAKGLQLQVSFPESWSIEEAKRPNSVAMAVSRAGRGLEVCVVTVHTTEQLGWPPERARSETVRSFAEPARLRQVAADMQGDFLDGGAANIEGLPARWVVSIPQVSRDGGDTVYPSVTYQVLFRAWMLSMNCGTGGRGREEALARFKQHEPLFRLIANSIVLPQRWR